MKEDGKWNAVVNCVFAFDVHFFNYFYFCFILLAQLICPISYDDPDDQWKRLEPLLNEKLPLRDVSWKSPISSTFITINKLPLRFLPSSSSLFKDTDHSFRWFLSPYVYVYILVAESMDSYKVLKPNLKKWIDARNNPTG